MSGKSKPPYIYPIHLGRMGTPLDKRELRIRANAALGSAIVDTSKPLETHQLYALGFVQAASYLAQFGYRDPWRVQAENSVALTRIKKEVANVTN